MNGEDDSIYHADTKGWCTEEALFLVNLPPHLGRCGHGWSTTGEDADEFPQTFSAFASLTGPHSALSFNVRLCFL